MAVETAEPGNTFINAVKASPAEPVVFGVFQNGNQGSQVFVAWKSEADCAANSIPGYNFTNAALRCTGRMYVPTEGAAASDGVLGINKFVLNANANSQLFANG